MQQHRFSIQFVGTGNAWSKPPANFNTNAMVTVDGHRWLIDCGLLCPIGLRDLDIPQETIDGIFVTHLHGDHTNGLEELLFYNYYAHSRTLDLWLPSAFWGDDAARYGCHLWHNCLRGAMESWLEREHRMLTLEDFTDIHLLYTHDTTEIHGLRSEIFPVEHVPRRPSFGILLDGRVAYTSDCTFSRARIDALLERGTTTIFHEVTFLPPYPGNVHTSFEEILSLPRDIATRIILMHYADILTPDTLLRVEDAGFRLAERGKIYEF